MENENFLDDFLNGKLDYVSFMECLDGLDLQDKLDLDNKVKDLLQEYFTKDKSIKCANRGHDFEDWKECEVGHRGLEDGSNDCTIEYYRICQKCGFEEKSYVMPKEFEAQQIKKEIEEHKEQIKKLEKKLGGLNGR